MPNRAPTLTYLEPSTAFGENAVNAAPALIDADVTFRDLDGNFAGGTIIVSGLLAEDRVSILNEGFGAGEIGLFGVNVTYGGVAIGTFAGGIGNTLTISLNSTATSAAVEALIENLAYANVSDSPTEFRTLNIEVRDAAGAPVVRTASFTQLVGPASPYNGIDVGLNSAPAFADLDGDGVLDLVVGNRDGILQTFFSGSTVIGNPFAGIDVGDYARPVFGDIDGDGDQDLLVGGTNGFVQTYLNVGGTFALSTGFGINPTNGIDFGSDAAPTLGDFDGDGDLDIVVGNLNGNYRALRNDGATFTELLGTANPFGSIDPGFVSSGAFVDIDGDGDVDFVTGDLTGGVGIFRNENGTFIPFAGDTHPFLYGSGAGSMSMPSFADVDGDGDMDAVIGQANGTLAVQRNDAPLGRSIVVQVVAEADVPSLTNLATSVGFLENSVNAAPVLLDADVNFALGSSGLDGGRLVVSGLLFEDRVSVRNEGGGAGQIGLSGNVVSYGGVAIGTVSGGFGNTFTVTFNAAATGAAVDALIENLTYANVSNTPAPSRTLTFNVIDSAGGAALPAPDFVEVTGPANPFNSIVTGYAAPVFADIDGDNDLDVVVGRQGIFRTFRNDSGVYTQLTGADDPFAGIYVSFNATASFYDRDQDGDLDVVMGGDGFGIRLLSLRNDGGVFVPLDAADDPFDTFVFDRSITPAIVDLDGDGDHDLALGRHDGAILYYRNDGGTYVEQTGAANPFAAINVTSYTSPAFADLDGDGDFDLLVTGDVAGFTDVARTFRNDGGTFVEVTGADNPLDGLLPTAFARVRRPTFQDTDGDGDLDLVVGETSGPLRFFRNDAAASPTITVNVTAENDIPSLSGLAASASFGENAVNAAPVLLDASVAFDAGSGGMDGGTLTVSGLLAEDRLTILSEGPIAVSGASISYLGTEIGTFSGGVGGALTVTFTAAATSVAIDALIERIAYQNVSDAPAASRVLTLDIVDAVGAPLAGGPQDMTVNVAAVNDPPTLTGLAASATFLENDVNAAPALLDSDVTFTDPDENLEDGTLTVSGLLAEDRIGVRDQGLGSGTIALFGSNIIYDGVAIGTFSGGNGTTFTVTFNSAVTASAVDALIQNLTYANVSDTPTADRTLSLDVVDGGGNALDGGPQSILVSVTPANDGPSGADSSDTVTQSDVLTFTAADFSTGMTDAEGNGFAGIHIATTPTAGTLLLNGVEITGPTDVSLADLDAGLLTYEPETGGGGDGPQTFTFQVRDNGGTADGGVDLDPTANTFTVNVTAVNQAPIIDLDFTDSPAVDTTATYIEGQGPVTIAPLALVDDPDAPANFDGYTLTVAFTANGTLDDQLAILSGGFGPTDIFVIGNDIYYGGPLVATFTGGVNGAPLVISFNDDACGCALEAVAASIAYFNTSDTPSPLDRGITFTVDDGSSINSSASAVATVTVIPNDPPALSGVAPAVTFGENLVNSAPQLLAPDVTLTDGDDNFDGGTLTVTGLLFEDEVAIRSVGTAAGEISVSGADVLYGGIVIGSFAGGSGDSLVVTFNGDATAQAVEAVIENLTYSNFSDTPTADRTLVVNVTDSFGADLGSNGAPGLSSFEPLRGPLNPFAGVSVYGFGAPTFVDIDGDDDFDLVVGDAYGFIYLYENDAGVFTKVADADNPFDGLSLDNFVKPTFADIDGDDDLDLVVGGQFGELQLFENDNGQFVERIGAANPLDSVSVGYASAPTFADIDGDGDLDLVVGDYFGSLHAYENDSGTFVELTGSDNPFGSILVDYSASPAFVDLDGDGDLDLVVADAEGALSTFENDGGTFTELTGLDNPFDRINIGYFPAPAFADIDGDGDLDLALGSYFGAVEAFENDGAHGVPIVLTVTPENDAPILDLDFTDIPAVDTDADWAAGDPPVVIAPFAFVGDPDFPANYGGYRVTAEFTANGSAGDRLTIASVGDGPGEVRVTGGNVFYEGVLVGSFTGGVNGVRLTITFNANACACAVELVTASISYSNNSGSPSILDRTVTFTVDDGSGAGNATATALATISVSINTINGTPMNDVLNGTAVPDLINGLGADDVLRGNGGNDVINGNDGLDFLYGGDGNDQLNGGAGKDFLDGGTGADTAAGGSGDDRYYVESGDTVVEADGEGTDIVYARTSFVLAAGASIELLAAADGAGTDPINLTGNDLNNSVQGNAGANRLLGGGGSDYLTGFAGHDTLDGGTGNDIMVGGVGNDRYYVDTSADRVVELAGEGNDIVYARASFTLAAGSSIELLAAADGAATDAINLGGNELANTVQGNAGANILLGGAGSDYLNALGGADVLDGGAGADIMLGGLGADIFRFSTAGDSALGAADRVMDFVSGTDKVDLSLIDAVSSAAGNQAFTLIGAGAFTGTAGQLRAVSSAGRMHLYGDVNGDGVADLHIILEGLPALAPGDVVL